MKGDCSPEGPEQRRLQGLVQDARARFLGAPEPWWIACSGGADSTLLALFATRWGGDIRLLHVHHHLRARAHADEEAVRNLAQTLHVPLVVLHAGPAEGEEQEGREGQARRRRVQALRAWLSGRGGTLFFGHQGSDALETLVLRLTRGTGMQGLAAFGPEGHVDGMPLRRPLWSWHRAEVRGFLATQGLGWVDDETNDDAGRTRNRVRPALDALCDSLAAGEAASLAASLAGLHEEATLWCSTLDQRIRDVGARRGETASMLRRATLAALPAPERRALIARLCASLAPGTTRTFVERVSEAIASNGVREINGARHWAEVGRHGVLLMAKAPGERLAPSEAPQQVWPDDAPERAWESLGGRLVLSPDAPREPCLWGALPAPHPRQRLVVQSYDEAWGWQRNAALLRSVVPDRFAWRRLRWLTVDGLPLEACVKPPADGTKAPWAYAIWQPWPELAPVGAKSPSPGLGSVALPGK